MDDEKKLLHELKNGDVRAFESLLTRYERLIFAYLYRMVQNRSDAEDLTQETFLKLYTHRRAIDPEKKFHAWLFRVATTTCYDWLRKKKRSKELLMLDDPEAEGETIPDDASYNYRERLQTAQEMEAALAKLNPTHRTILLLCYRHDLSYQDIADTLGIPVNTVKTHVHRAKKALKEKLI